MSNYFVDGGTNNEKQKYGKQYADIVCNMCNNEAKCCNKCDAGSLSTCGKFGVHGVPLVVYAMNCATCGHPQDKHHFRYY